MHSFDYDPDSFGCTSELKRRYFPNDPDWMVERGSVLDQAYLGSLGEFDVVYSWGVLHHTGQMWQALENVKPLVKVGGTLFISIYNDLAEVTDAWQLTKERYNALPRPLALAYALGIIAREECIQLRRHIKAGTTHDWWRNWRDYASLSGRGMSRWHDWIDWIGGLPYDRATIEQIVDVFGDDGFRLANLFDCAGYGCNEFAFHREGPAGTVIESKIPSGNSLARRHGLRVFGPFEKRDGGIVGYLRTRPVVTGRGTLLLISDDEIRGPVAVDDEGAVIVAAANADLSEASRRIHSVVAAETRRLLPPFAAASRAMWSKAAPDLASLADREGAERASPVYVFEDDRQLPFPHATHADIADIGLGRFSHWGGEILFSTRDNGDPNTTQRRYELVIVWPESFDHAAALGLPHGIPATVAPDGTVITQTPVTFGSGERFMILADARVLGEAVQDDAGLRLKYNEARGPTGTGNVTLVPGRLLLLAGPYRHVRGLMWEVVFPDLADMSDGPGRPTSPVVLLENGQPAGLPHWPHDDIAASGSGNYSHWGATIIFSTRDGTDPNQNGANYHLFVPRIA